MTDKPKYVVLEKDLSAKHAANYLGILVTDVRRPLDEYEPVALSLKEPEPPLPFIKKYMADPKHEKNVTIKPNRIRQHNARLALLHLLGLDSLIGTKETYELKSKKVVTYEVEQYPKVFNELLQTHGDAVRDLMSRPSAQKGVFMLIGCKVASNGVVQHGNAAISSASAAGKIIAPDPVSGGTVTQTIPIAEAKASTKQAWSNVVAGTAVGERVFAAEYCEIRWKKTGFELGPPGVIRFKKMIQNTGIKSYGSKALAFAGGPDSEADDENDEEGEHEHDDLM